MFNKLIHFYNQSIIAKAEIKEVNTENKEKDKDVKDIKENEINCQNIYINDPTSSSSSSDDAKSTTDTIYETINEYTHPNAVLTSTSPVVALQSPNFPPPPLPLSVDQFEEANKSLSYANLTNVYEIDRVSISKVDKEDANYANDIHCQLIYSTPTNKVLTKSERQTILLQNNRDSSNTTINTSIQDSSSAQLLP